MSQQDILDATKSIKTTDPQKIFESLFTKDFKLKKTVGKAEKSWCLKGNKRFKDSSDETALNDAKNVFMDLVSGSGKTKRKFVFERQKLNSIRRGFCADVLAHHGNRTSSEGVISIVHEQLFVLKALRFVNMCKELQTWLNYIVDSFMQAFMVTVREKGSKIFSF